MRTRSTSKHEPFVMLDDDRKSSIPQDFMLVGHSTSLCEGHRGEREADNMLRQHLCGWACQCFLTRLNFVIACCLFTGLLYALCETTFLFENLSATLSNKTITITDADRQAKSVEHFLETHYVMLCLIGPVTGLSFLAIQYLQQSSCRLEQLCPCAGTTRARSSPASSAR